MTSIQLTQRGTVAIASCDNLYNYNTTSIQSTGPLTEAANHCDQRFVSFNDRQSGTTT
jgi:hypothetical protein